LLRLDNYQDGLRHLGWMSEDEAFQPGNRLGDATILKHPL
jgi:hypothetical protein